MQQASINLTQSLHEVYEPDWHGKDDVLTIGKVRIINASHRHDMYDNTTKLNDFHLK